MVKGDILLDVSFFEFCLHLYKEQYVADKLHLLKQRPCSSLAPYENDTWSGQSTHWQGENFYRNRSRIGKSVTVAGTKFSLEDSEYKSSTFGNTADSKLGWEKICESTIHSLESVLLFDKGLRHSFTGTEKTQKPVYWYLLIHWNRFNSSQLCPCILLNEEYSYTLVL